jgi:hypothetical protein
MKKTNLSNQIEANDEMIINQIYVIREQKVMIDKDLAMLSSILNSTIAIQVNINIIRIFVKMRQVLTDQLSIRLELAEIKEKLQQQDKKQHSQNQNIEIIFRYLDELQYKFESVAEPKRKIGFKPDWDKAEL